MKNTGRATVPAENVKTRLGQIRYLSRQQPKLRFTSLYHYLNEEMLRDCFDSVRANRAAGVDEQCKEDYGKDLTNKISDLTKRLKDGSYRAKAVRRVLIPKASGRGLRPLGIPTVEDCIVQEAVRRILEAIFEPMFMDISHGFRPGRSCHTALKRMSQINRLKIRSAIEVDIESFFDRVDHEWLLKFVAYRIADPRLLRLVKKMLKCGYVEDGKWHPSTRGVPQGGVVSPILANIYLHFVFDLWFEKRLRRLFSGVEAVRYADDIALFSKSPNGMKLLLERLRERMKQFGLTLSQEKTRIIPFGALEAWISGVKGCQSLDFLGFTHFIRKNYRGKLYLTRRTSQKSFGAGLRGLSKWLRENRSKLPMDEILKRVKVHLQGHYEYFGVTDNGPHLSRYTYAAHRIVHHWLNKRSQRHDMGWDKFGSIWKTTVPRYTIKVDLSNRRPIFC